MSEAGYIIRNYRPSDFNNFVQLKAEAEKLEPTGRYTSPRAVSKRLGQPNYVPEQDLLIAEIAGKVIGYIDVTPELGIGRVVLDCLVHPEHRRKGIATELFHRARHRAIELGARIVHLNIPQDNVAAKSLLSRLGFELIRRFPELRLELGKVRLLNAGHSVYQCRHLQHDEEDKLTDVQNRSFADTWGYNPSTIERITYRVNQGDCSPEDVILVCEGDKPIGYCWTTINPEENIALGISKGRIYMLGVDPDYRGKGIGKLALLKGLSHLRGKGIEVAELTVDSENRAACALYESVGFKISSTSEWYEKALD